ncbi:hypothetical protein M434DRAFT_34851 [Hypoxylon sp. CO27-5]|nr:hypothetical protein M434DRAFT_34851 [Hypoxylon sp. CO27-5]
MTYLVKLVYMFLAALQARTALAGVTFDGSCSVYDTERMLNEVIDVANNALNVLENFHFDPNAPWDYYAKAGLADSLFTSEETALNRARENFKAIRNVKRWRTKIYVICNDYGIIQDAEGGGKLRYLAASHSFEHITGDEVDTLGSCSSPVNEGSYIYGYGFTPKVAKSVDDHQYIVLCRNEVRSYITEWQPVQGSPLDSYHSLGGTLFHELFHRATKGKSNLGKKGNPEYYGWQGCTAQAGKGSRNPESLVLYGIAQWNNHFNFCYGYAETPTALWQNLRATEWGRDTINTWRLTDPNPPAQGQAGQAGS